MSEPNTIDIRKLSKVLELLASDKEGEVLTAARHATSMVSRAGLRFEALLSADGDQYRNNKIAALRDELSEEIEKRLAAQRAARNYRADILERDALIIRLRKKAERKAQETKKETMTKERYPSPNPETSGEIQERLSADRLVRQMERAIRFKDRLIESLRKDAVNQKQEADAIVGKLQKNIDDLIERELVLKTDIRSLQQSMRKCQTVLNDKDIIVSTIADDLTRARNREIGAIKILNEEVERRVELERMFETLNRCLYSGRGVSERPVAAA